MFRTARSKQFSKNRWRCLIMTLTECKINLLKYGVNFAPISLFNGVDEKIYKLKHLNKSPKSLGNQVFDQSDQNDMIPAEILLKKNDERCLTKLRFSNDSPLTLIYKDEELQLFYRDKLVDVECYLVKYNPMLNKKIPNEISKRGFTIGDYVSVVGLDRVTILFYDGCFNWLTCKNCKFCDLHPVRESDVVARPTINDLYKYDSIASWWRSQREEYIKCVKYSLKMVLDTFENENVQIFFMAGNLENNTQTWEIALDVVDEITKEIDISKYINYVNIAPHDTLESLSKIKKMGIKNVQYNLEVSTKALFEEYCPGKMKYDMFLNKMVEAVSVMGKGHVRSNFVLGLENTDALLKFADEYGAKGIVVDYSVFQPKKGTPLCNHPTLGFDKVIDFSKKLCKIYEKYNQKPIFSPVGSRSSIMNELYMGI